MFLRFPGGMNKALTFSYDDGVEQDVELMRILDDHHLKATFNLNSGLFAPEGHVWPKEQLHRRMTRSQVLEVYANSNHEVAVHCAHHASLPELSPEGKTREVMEDRLALEAAFGRVIRGMAYPYGTYDDASVETLRSCGFRYARTVISTHHFALPNDWLRLGATCHHNDPQLMTLADQFLNQSSPFGCKLFYLWGHAYEFEADQNWHVIQDFADKMANREDIWYATNIEICDYVLDWKLVYTSADGKTLINPTSRTFWFSHEGTTQILHPGEVLHL